MHEHACECIRVCECSRVFVYVCSYSCACTHQEVSSAFSGTSCVGKQSFVPLVAVVVVVVLVVVFSVVVAVVFVVGDGGGEGVGFVVVLFPGRHQDPRFMLKKH